MQQAPKLERSWCVSWRELPSLYGSAHFGPVTEERFHRAITTNSTYDIILGLCDNGSVVAPAAGSAFTLLPYSSATQYSAMEYEIVSATQSSLPVVWGSVGTCHGALADAIE